MADISVHIFVQNLRDLLKSEHPNIADEKDQLQSLYNDVFLMGCFLKTIEEKYSFDDENANNLVTEVREIVREAENIVDYFVVDELSLDLKSLQKQIDKVKIEMDQMNANFDRSIVVGDIGNKIQKAQPRERCDENLEAAVGLDETIEKILAGFDGDQEMDVISVVGLPGIGKTTLAQKVFVHSCTRSSFEVRAWVTVSQTYSSKQLLIDILQSSSLYKDNDAGSNEDRLGEELLKRLKGKKYFIVLDDIWSIEAWNSIERSFPPNCNGSKVIFTSRFVTIGKDLCRDINTHNLSGLSEEHSWNLLKSKVFGSGDQRICTPELERFGREIARKCDGLPLAIVVIGGLLAKKAKTPEQWRQVARNLAPSIATDREAYMETLALSYKHLPVHLKACFLYLGTIFPEDYEIPVRKLVWLLIAEGFVIQENDEQQIQSSEVIVEGYLNELVERRLVTVGRKRSCGATKTFQIHDLLRDFCLVRSQLEKFIHKQPMLDRYSDSPDITLKEHRRLVVRYINFYGFLDRPFTSNLRSFICDDSLWFDGNKAALIAHGFRFLKMLELQDASRNFFNQLENMVHLRYLAVLSTSNLNAAISSVTKLLYLETLFLHTKEATDMPDDIWNMIKLRHLYNKEGVFHFKASRSQGANRSSVLPDLQTLHTLCACKSCLKKLVRTPNLKKLGLLGSLISVSGCSIIPDLGFLEQLVTLKLTNSSFYSYRSSVIVQLKLPTSLQKLTLQNTLLKWEEISVLAELENLEVLKLLDEACVEADENSDWDTSDLDFPKLKYLKMRRLDIVKWDDQDLHCESLEVLVLEDCKRLESIPFDLAQIPLLHTMEVTRCNPLVEILAKEIEEEHECQCGNRKLQVFIKS